MVRFIRSFVFRFTVTGKQYLRMLQDKAFPVLRQENPEWFQRDGASLHYAMAENFLLDEQFPEHWICQREPVEWPPEAFT